MTVMVAGVLGTAAAHAQPTTQCGQWEHLLDGLTEGFPVAGGPRVSDLITFNAGDGPMLYIAGNFATLLDPAQGEVEAPALARFDGQAWSVLPGLDAPELEPNGRAIALQVWDDGTGPALYVGGAFTRIAGLSTNGIARFDGRTWSVPAQGPLPHANGRVHDIHAHDFGRGPQLTVAGEFWIGDPPNPQPGVHRFNGSSWTQVGQDTPTRGPVYELASFRGDLYASGRFAALGEGPSAFIARFDGLDWSTPSNPSQELRPQEFWPLENASIGGDPVLLAGGRFGLFEAGELVAFNSVLAWDGDEWAALVPPTEFFASIMALAVDGQGSGQRIYIAGANSERGHAIAEVRDGVLQHLPGIGNSVFGLLTYDSGAAPTLLAAGSFENPSGFDGGLARWRPAAPCPADLNGDCVADLNDFLAFQNLFDAGDPLADFDGDGELTIFDFLAFQNEFDQGCE
ncbi:hypothetical protein AY599_28475 [Leptolyngbya valderiana BDU 20041]|nr:hypothetical protein AY599_28475 [Leptolyngbya valderiana BDU 20041]